jgi:serine/threonine-protein kinase
MRQSIERYEIRGIAGRGAMGTVYDAWDARLERRVAVKTLNLSAADDDTLQEQLLRFHREAKIVATLHHTNVVQVFDFGETADEAYLVMEFIDGQSIKNALNSGPRFSLQQTQSVILSVLDGLHYSHSQGVVHRDIKPANIMMTTDGRTKITDFGVARLEGSSVTQTGIMIGTPAYMSPEQCLGLDVDLRVDIYSTGVMLYELVTGRRAFEGDITSIIYKILNTTLERPSLTNAGLPRALDAVIARAMARERTDRFSTAREFRDALMAAFSDATVSVASCGQLSLGTQPSGGVRAGGFVRPDLSRIPAYVEPPKETRTVPPRSYRVGFLLLGFISLMTVMLCVFYLYPSEAASNSLVEQPQLQVVAPLLAQSQIPNRHMLPSDNPPLPAAIRLPVLTSHSEHLVQSRPRYRN